TLSLPALLTGLIAITLFSSALVRRLIHQCRHAGVTRVTYYTIARAENPPAAGFVISVELQTLTVEVIRTTICRCDFISRTVGDNIAVAVTFAHQHRIMVRHKGGWTTD